MSLLFCFLLTTLSLNHAFVVQKQRTPFQRQRHHYDTFLQALTRGDARGAAFVMEGASVYRGSSPILSSIDWRVEPNAKWAIVGANGCGKTTLLKTLVGHVDCDEGRIVISTTQQVGYLQQTAVAGSNKTIYEEAASAMKDIQEARASLEQAQEAVQKDPSDMNLKSLDAATQSFESVGGYTQEQTISSVLKGLGFEDMNQQCDELSGGWQMRVALARLLLSQPTLLLLDEPSNHLDQNARLWLTKYLQNYQAGAMILVTHDVGLLECVSHIAELAGGSLTTYKSCTYSQYLKEKQQRAYAAAVQYQRIQEKAAKLQAFIDRFGASATKASAAQSRLKQLEKMKQQGLLDEPTTTKTSTRFRPTLVLPDPLPVIGESLLTLQGASVGWNTTPLVSNINLDIKKGMKIWIRGRNGAGKSTILAALTGKLNLLEGARTENDKLRLGVFTQDLAQELDQDARAVDLVVQHAREGGNVFATEEDARSIMGRLGLTGEKPLSRVGELSGGEKARVALSMFGIKAHNALILDEPSNHMDQECISATAKALSEWEGTVVIVSHDKWFCETIGFTHVGTVDNGSFLLEERSLRPSDWSEYAEESGDDSASNDKSAIAGDESKQAQALDRKRQKQAYNAPKRIAKLQELLEELEVQAAAVDEEMMQHGSNVEKLMELSERKERLNSQMEEYMNEWQELEELLLQTAQ